MKNYCSCNSTTNAPENDQRRSDYIQAVFYVKVLEEYLRDAKQNAERFKHFNINKFAQKLEEISNLLFNGNEDD